jgi:hypothetical protein
MPLEGRIAVDIGFTDTATSSDTVQALKRISLVDSTSYTTGKVAVVTGTVTTAAVALWSQGSGIQFGGYKDSSGNAVTMGSVSRIALRGSGNGVKVEDEDVGVVELFSVNNDVSIGNNVGLSLTISALSGTAAFTAVLYGS